MSACEYTASYLNDNLLTRHIRGDVPSNHLAYFSKSQYQKICIIMLYVYIIHTYAFHMIQRYVCNLLQWLSRRSLDNFRTFPPNCALFVYQELSSRKKCIACALLKNGTLIKSRCYFTTLLRFTSHIFKKDFYIKKKYS